MGIIIKTLESRQKKLKVILFKRGTNSDFLKGFIWLPKPMRRNMKVFFAVSLYNN